MVMLLLLLVNTLGLKKIDEQTVTRSKLSYLRPDKPISPSDTVSLKFGDVATNTSPFRRPMSDTPLMTQVSCFVVSLFPAKLKKPYRRSFFAESGRPFHAKRREPLT